MACCWGTANHLSFEGTTVPLNYLYLTHMYYFGKKYEYHILVFFIYVFVFSWIDIIIIIYSHSIP
jgi:hypothetical protein